MDALINAGGQEDNALAVRRRVLSDDPLPNKGMSKQKERPVPATHLLMIRFEDYPLAVSLLCKEPTCYFLDLTTTHLSLPQFENNPLVVVSI